MTDIMEILEQKFTSGNGHPVERAVITAQEYQALVQEISALEELLNLLHKN